jgi:predicted alpha-1,2-mannosidase
MGIATLTGLTAKVRVVAPSTFQLTQYVNPFIGTSPGGSSFGFGGDSGNTFPGATYPMGMLQWSPDTTSHLPGGYSYPDTTIKGFSLTHFSGRGCTVYQDIPFMPFVGTVKVSPATYGSTFYSRFSHSSESAHPGYYRVHLDGPNVTVALSVLQRTGIGQFTYPASTASTMLMNVGGSINGNPHAAVSISTRSNEVTGFATSKVGCGSNTYTLYFAALFDRPFSQYGTWNGGTVKLGSTSNAGSKSGAFVTFDTHTNKVVQVEVGISFVSIANALANLAAARANFNFSALRNNANTAWNTRLASIQVQGGTPDERTTFYTALYHAFIHPNIFSDVNGQYIGFDGRVHTVPSGHLQYENIPGWDEYRSLIRLRAILAPSETGDIVQSLVNDAQQGDGHLPRWEQANADSHGMNGDDGTLLVAEAYAFGATQFDTAGALVAMINGQSKIREGLSDYLKLGYVASGTTGNSAAITQEYTNADFAIAQFARSLGHTADYATYLQRSDNWQKLFNTSTGYIQPRTSGGSWVANFSPTSESGFQEGDSAQYSWMEPFNLRRLFDLMGGPSAVVKRLDTFFTTLNAGPDRPYAFMGNEPSFEVPWEYDFAGAPSHTQNVVRHIQTRLFKNSPGGLPGNDDGGAMSSWYVFAAIGLYPEITGVGGFVIGSPLFTAVTVRLAGGHTLQIHAPSASDRNAFVQSLTMNGNATTSLWIAWSAVQHGATLNYTLASSATNWGSEPGDAPPSYPAALTKGPGFNNEGISNDNHAAPSWLLTENRHEVAQATPFQRQW